MQISNYCTGKYWGDIGMDALIALMGLLSVSGVIVFLVLFIVFAAYKKKIWKIFLVLFLLCIALFVVAIAITPTNEPENSDTLSSGSQDIISQESDASNSNGMSQTDETESDMISVSAEQLYTDYEENVVNADNIYKGNIIIVTGTITDIGQDILSGDPCISLDSGDDFGFYPIQCFFTKNTDGLENLRDGDSVTIIGECTGYQIANVQLTDCKLQQDAATD